MMEEIVVSLVLDFAMACGRADKQDQVSIAQRARPLRRLDQFESDFRVQEMQSSSGV